MANLAGIILAAGQGTRMKSARPKVMHAVAGRPILGHVIAAVRAAGIDRLVVVTAADAEEARAYANAEGAECVIQEPQLGTVHAANAARDRLKDFDGTVITTYGDMPLVTAAMFHSSRGKCEQTGLSLVAFQAKDPAAYGRVFLDSGGLLDRIVEFNDANEDERANNLCNAGIFAADARSFFRWASAIGNANKKKEYYLTEVPDLARRDGVRCGVVIVDETAVLGINTRVELARAESEMQKRLRRRMLENGVGMLDPGTVYLSFDTVLEPEVQIEPFVVLGPGVVVRSGATIRAFSHLVGAEV